MRREFSAEIKDLREGRVRNVFLLAGDDYFLQEFLIREIVRILRKKGEVEKFVWVPDAGDSEAIVRELNSVPMFAQPRLFIVYEPTRMKGKLRDELLESCRDTNRDNVVVLVMNRLDPKKKVMKKLSDDFGPINTSPPFPGKMAGFVTFLFRQSGLEATREAVDILLELCGDSLYHIANEIGKLSVYLENGRKVEASDVLKLSGWKRGFFPWQFLDAVGKRDFPQAIRRGMAIIDGGTDLSMLIFNLTGMFQELFFRHVSRRSPEETEGGKSQARPIMNISTQIQRKLSEYLELYGPSDVSRVLRLLARADRQLKSTGSEVNSIFVPLIHRITVSHA